MDLKLPMKNSIILGLIGSALVPLLYEAYANIGKTFAVVLLLAWVVFCFVRFARFPAKEALLSVTCLIAYTGILGIVMYCIIHPAVQAYLEKNSKYYYLTFKEEMWFFASAIGAMLMLYVLLAVRLMVQRSILKFRENSERAGRYIDNAFDSSEDGQEL